MKVYVAWNDGDYYGPDPLGNRTDGGYVFDSFEKAQRAIEARVAEYSSYRPSEWEFKWGVWRYDMHYIEEVEVA